MSESIDGGTTTNLRWKALPPPSLKQYDGSAALVRNSSDNSAVGIVLAGGRCSQTDEAVKTVELLEYQLMKWWKLPSLRVERYGCATASVNDTVLVIGGSNSDASALDTAEQWTMGGTSWEAIAEPMSTPRWFAAAVGVKQRKTSVVFVVGGRDASWRVLNTVEEYDLVRQSWSTLAPMKSPRFGCAVVSLSPSRLMVMGGYDGTNILNSCQAYDVSDDLWTDMAPMPKAVAFCSATTVTRDDSRYVFVVGQVASHLTNSIDEADDDEDDEGEVFSLASNIIQCYSVELRKWKIITASEMLVCGPLLSIHNNLVVIGKRSQQGDEESNPSQCLTTRWIDLWKKGAEQPQSSASVSSFPSRRASPSVASTSEYSTPVVVARLISQPSVSDTTASSSVVDGVTVNRVRNVRMKNNFGKAVCYSGDVSLRTNKPHGKGRMVWDVSGEVYDGEWVEGQRHGYGLSTIPYEGETYEGHFVNDKKNGRGVYTWSDGRQYKGMYLNDLREDSNGILTWGDGTKYVGQFVRGKREGKGRMEYKNGVWYEGEFVNDRYEGFGAFRFQDGKTYRGMWKSGKAHGRGILTAADGSIVYDGLWEGDKPVLGKSNERFSS